MQFVKNGDRYLVSRVTGPSSYFLSFEIGTPGELVIETVEGAGSPSRNQTAIEDRIREAVEKTSQHPSFRERPVRLVRYALGDGGSPETYQALATEVLRRIADECSTGAKYED